MTTTAERPVTVAMTLTTIKPMDFVTIVMFVGILLLMVGVFFLVRNDKVYEFRMRLLHRVSEMCKKDAEQQLEWPWRYEQMGWVSYDEMVYKFWKPLRASAFYPALGFCGGEVT